MSLVFQPATESDLETVKRIVNTHNLALNPHEKRMGDLEALSYIRGLVDPAMALLTKSEGSSEWQGFVTLNPDNSRKRMYLDIYTTPDSACLEDTFGLALKVARQHQPDFQLLLGLMAQDLAYIELLKRQNFSLYRRYWTMQMELNQQLSMQDSNWTSIREIDLDDEREIKSFYDVHQDSFSKHFGFMPRAYPDWCDLVLRDKEEKGLRVWLLSEGNSDVGFLDCDNELLHEDSGFVSGLGVRYGFQGKGYGESLLKLAIKVHADQGLSKLCLSVDAGNESGALRLYEKVGMKAISESHHYENPNWNQD